MDERGKPVRKVRKTALKSVRAYCVEVCCAGSPDWVRECPDGVEHQGKPPCPLFPHRMGKSSSVSDETRERRRKAMLDRIASKTHST